MKGKKVFFLISLCILIVAVVWFLPYLGTWLDGDLNVFEINIGNVTEILVTDEHSPGALSITDPNEIRSVFSKALLSSSHWDIMQGDSEYLVRAYHGSTLEKMLFPEEGLLYNKYNKAFAKELSRLVQRLKNGETNVYQYVISIPPKVQFAEAVDYLRDNGYDYRNYYSNDYTTYYPHLRLQYRVSEDDLNKYTEKELRGDHVLGKFGPDNRLSAFIEQLKKKEFYVSCELIGDEGLGTKRGTTAYLSKYLSEEELKELERLAETEEVRLSYFEPSKYEYKIILLSGTALSDGELQKINDGLEALAP